MTVNEMMMLSKVFLGMMIVFLIAAVVVFFVLDVRKAWRILTGKRVPVSPRKKEPVKPELKSNKVNELVSREPKESESINNYFEGYHPTTVLADNEGATTVLTDSEEATTVLANKSENNIVTDITFIHTEITL